MQDFRNLKVWQKAHAFVLNVYQLTVNFPQHELFGLRTQLRRGATLIPAHLAEACGSDATAEFRRLTQLAFRSACENEYFLLLAHDLGYFADEDYTRLNDDLVEVKRMLSGLLHSLTTDH
jgi:four helix bundle protein